MSDEGIIEKRKRQRKTLGIQCPELLSMLGSSSRKRNRKRNLVDELSFVGSLAWLPMRRRHCSRLSLPK